MRFFWIGLFAAIIQAAGPEVPKPAASPAEQRKAIEAAMQSSLAKQRASVQRQVQSAVEADAGWFTTAWPADAPTPPQIRPQAASPEVDSAAVRQTSALQIADCIPVSPAMVNLHVDRAARREGLPPDLLRAVIRNESAYDPCAVSRKGALGLMQLMAPTAAAMGVTNPLDPLQNLYGGAHYLGQLFSKYGGDAGLALGAYNAGPTTVDAYGGLPPYEETRQYVQKILGEVNPGPD